MHYPPVFMQDSIPEFFEVMNQYGVRRCYYGHIHSQGCRFAFQGEWCGVQLEMVSADYLRFMPKKIVNRKLFPSTGGISKKNVL